MVESFAAKDWYGVKDSGVDQEDTLLGSEQACIFGHLIEKLEPLRSPSNCTLTFVQLETKLILDEELLCKVILMELRSNDVS